MDEIIEFLAGFEFEAEPGEAMLDLFMKVITCQAAIASLKELTINNLSQCTNKTTDILENEFKEIFDSQVSEQIAKFVVKYGKVSH